jgi:ATP-dependent Clp protease ATP-binding subunit ClpA
MTIRKRKVDVNTKRAVTYMQDAARNRNIKLVGVNLFAYSIMRSCSNYIDQYVPSDKIEMAASEMGELIPSPHDENIEPLSIEEIKYDGAISDYVSRVESEDLPGVISILLDIVTNNPEIKKILEDNNIFSYDLERASKFEAARKKAGGKKRTHGKRVDDVFRDMSMPVQQRKQKGDIEGYCTNLTEMAKKGLIGDVFCRDYEISKVITSLLRKIKSNPLLIGEPGVGKTAIIEGLASKVVNGDVPERLRNCTVMSLDVSSVVGGTTLRGEFEERMKSIMIELTSKKDIILFIDEIHMIVGAGDHTGSMDAGNILKPYLARGDIKCIGATTHYEYNKHMKKDGALARRFQRITVDELSEDQTIDIMRGLAPSFESFHNVKISDEAIKIIVSLSGKHIADRYLPDKAIDCLDEACARAVILDQDVGREIVEESMADLASVPVSIIRQSTSDMRKRMVKTMKDAILGNDEAIDKFCSTASSRSSSVSSGDRPLCTVIVKGPKGVGKKSCIGLAALEMFGSKDFIVNIDGADYSEPHSISKIIGSPPGYVGYSDEGILKGVKRNPHSIVMITGVQLMHPSVKEQMVKIARDGKIKDSEGEIIDFRSSTVVFVCDDLPKSKSMGFASSEKDAPLDKAVWKDIIDNSDDIIEFLPVEDDETMRKILNIEIGFMKGLYKMAGKTLSVNEDEINKVFSEVMPCPPSEMRRRVRKKIEMMEISSSKGALENEAN